MIKVQELVLQRLSLIKVFSSRLQCMNKMELNKNQVEQARQLLHYIIRAKKAEKQRAKAESELIELINSQPDIQSIDLQLCLEISQDIMQELDSQFKFNQTGLEEQYKLIQLYNEFFKQQNNQTKTKEIQVIMKNNLFLKSSNTLFKMLKMKRKSYVFNENNLDQFDNSSLNQTVSNQFYTNESLFNYVNQVSLSDYSQYYKAVSKQNRFRQMELVHQKYFNEQFIRHSSLEFRNNSQIEHSYQIPPQYQKLSPQVQTISAYRKGNKMFSSMEQFDISGNMINGQISKTSNNKNLNEESQNYRDLTNLYYLSSYNNIPTSLTEQDSIGNSALQSPEKEKSLSSRLQLRKTFSTFSKSPNFIQRNKIMQYLYQDAIEFDSNRADDILNYYQKKYWSYEEGCVSQLGKNIILSNLMARNVNISKSINQFRCEITTRINDIENELEAKAKYICSKSDLNYQALQQISQQHILQQRLLKVNREKTSDHKQEINRISTAQPQIQQKNQKTSNQDFLVANKTCQSFMQSQNSTILSETDNKITKRRNNSGINKKYNQSQLHFYQQNQSKQQQFLMQIPIQKATNQISFNNKKQQQLVNDTNNKINTQCSENQQNNNYYYKLNSISITLDEKNQINQNLKVQQNYKAEQQQQQIKLDQKKQSLHDVLQPLYQCQPQLRTQSLQPQGVNINNVRERLQNNTSQGQNRSISVQQQKVGNINLIYQTKQNADNFEKISAFNSEVQSPKLIIKQKLQNQQQTHSNKKINDYSNEINIIHKQHRSMTQQQTHSNTNIQQKDLNYQQTLQQQKKTIIEVKKQQAANNIQDSYLQTNRVQVRQHLQRMRYYSQHHNNYIDQKNQERIKQLNVNNQQYKESIILINENQTEKIDNESLSLQKCVKQSQPQQQPQQSISPQKQLNMSITNLNNVINFQQENCEKNNLELLKTRVKSTCQQQDTKIQGTIHPNYISYLGYIRTNNHKIVIPNKPNNCQRYLQLLLNYSPKQKE